MPVRREILAALEIADSVRDGRRRPAIWEVHRYTLRLLEAPWNWHPSIPQLERSLVLCR